MAFDNFESRFGTGVRDLLLDLKLQGIVLVKLPAERLSPNEDAVDSLRLAGERFATSQSFIDPNFLLLNIADRLHEIVPEGIRRVAICGESIRRDDGELHPDDQPFVHHFAEKS